MTSFSSASRFPEADTDVAQDLRESIGEFDNYSNEERGGLMHNAADYLYDAGETDQADRAYDLSQNYSRMSDDRTGEFEPDGRLEEDSRAILDHIKEMLGRQDLTG